MQCSFWFGRDGLDMTGEFFINSRADVAIGKFKNFDPAWVSEYQNSRIPPNQWSLGKAYASLDSPFIR